MIVAPDTTAAANNATPAAAALHAARTRRFVAVNFIQFLLAVCYAGAAEPEGTTRYKEFVVQMVLNGLKPRRR